MPLLSHPARAYLKHLFTAGNRHHVHSPFVFALVMQALRKQPPEEGCAPIERLRAILQRRTDTITVADLGAGPRRNRGPVRRVGQIARTALKPRHQAEQLARIARHFKPRTIVELGTSLGLTTLYLARAVPDARVYTMEGCPATAALAQDHFNQAGTGNITLHLGPFKEQLPQVLAAVDRLDFAYIDGHHAASPTLDYFEQCLGKAHNDSVFVIDDIHWSAGMEQAWSAIQAHPRVSVTIDLFHFGLAFLRREQPREHFRLRY